MKLAINIDRAAALRALQGAPADLGKALRLAVKAGARDVQAHAIQDHRYVPRSGNADRSISTEVDGLRARVFLDTGIAPYAPYLHEGTGFYGPRGHAIRIMPKPGKKLRWAYQGRFVYSSKGVTIVGIKPDPYLYRAADAQRPVFERRVNGAIRRVIKGRGL